MEWREYSSIIWTFDTDQCRVLEGVFAGWDSFEGGDFGECNRYFVDVPEMGRVSFIGGTAFDKTFEQADVVVGEEIHIEYGGKKDLKDGRKCNLFRLMIKRDQRPKEIMHPKKAKK